MSGAGDFNADGFADFLVGEGSYLDTAGLAGNVFLVFGGKDLPPEIALDQLRSRGIRIGSLDGIRRIGPLVGPWGDVNGDGQPDFGIGEVLVSANDPPVPNESRYFVVFGPYGEKSFIRGDSNRDGKIDLTDAVFILSWLFLGGSEPTCYEALDASDDGKIDLTDAIWVLKFLFQGGPAPPPPFPAPGPDPGKNSLGCRGF